ncbi:MAG: 7TM diverse intracellular signaling domain-containing protein [Crocinitomicaceae bacterium]
MKNCYLLLFLLSFSSFGQGQLTIDEACSILGTSVSNELSYFEDVSGTMSPNDFLEKKSTMKEVEITAGLENFDFTNSSFFIHFTLENQSGKDQLLVLETARPITNRVDLYCVDDETTVYSGDGIPFKEKSVPTNFSALNVSVPAGKTHEYVLHLTSDGENLTLPMVFFKQKDYVSMDSDRQLYMGIFLGIFLFVVIIYSAFFVLLKERLFLLYVVYAFFSGLMQISLDGYMHEFLFTSGGYFTHHCQLVLASLTVIIGMIYAMKYLTVTGRLRTVGWIIITIVGITMILSLVPGKLYEFTYLLINAFSLIGLVYMIVAALIQRRKKRDKVSKLFLIGLLFVGSGGLLFILGNFGVINAPLITLNSLKVGTVIEMIFLSIMMAGRYKELQEEREIAQQRLLIELKEKNRIAAETNERLEVEVEERTRQIEAQRMVLKEQNEDFLSSVIYANRIQSAVLSNEDKFRNILQDSFVLLKPKDVVSGDFYWIDELNNEPNDNRVAYVTADCTGHGVPGALVSIIGNHLLESVKASGSILDPGKALNELNVGMNGALNSKYSVEELQDGMDLTLCVVDFNTYKLSYSGAKNSVYIVRNNELIELKGQRKSIGFNPKADLYKFETRQFELQKNDIIYTCSDGYSDQFGGEKGKKFMTKRLRELFIEVSELPIEEQKGFLDATLMNWMKGHEQLDDILIVGVKV